MAVFLETFRIKIKDNPIDFALGYRQHRATYDL